MEPPPRGGGVEGGGTPYLAVLRREPLALRGAGQDRARHLLRGAKQGRSEPVKEEEKAAAAICLPPPTKRSRSPAAEGGAGGK